MNTIDEKVKDIKKEKPDSKDQVKKEKSEKTDANNPLGERLYLLDFIDDVNHYVGSNDAWLQNGFNEQIEQKVSAIAQEYGISSVSAVILCYFIEKYDEPYITESEIAMHMHTTRLSLVRHYYELESLRDKRLIRHRNGDRGSQYILIPAVMDALRMGKKYRPYSAQYLRPAKFFETVDCLFDQRESGDLDYKDFILELRTLIRRNKNIEFSKAIRSMNLDDNELIILMRLCQDAVLFPDMPDMCGLQISYIGRQYVESFPAFKSVIRSFEREQHRFFEMDLVRRTPSDSSDGLDYGEPSFILSENGKKLLLSDINISPNYEKGQSSREDGVIQPGSIKARELFYNEAENIQVQQIESALTGDNYKAIQKRLKEKNMNSGIICLFSGEPGTGKTETALQLARRTGRGIMKVDLSAIKDSYVGQSEKNIKAVFDAYRKLLEKNEIVPVLLFNEADGVLVKRISITEKTVNETVAMSYNTIQNIILDELENFEGILIATSNLICNMDTALERRFLYRVEFKKPSAELQKAIWRSLMPELPQETIDAIAKKFDLSGGQISNVARKSAINYALTGKDADLASLETLCKEEKSAGTTVKNIGFAA